MVGPSFIDELRKLKQIPFESPSRGAVCIARLGYGLPESESLAELSQAARALAAIARTIKHPHSHETWIDQYGEGRRFELKRHVTEGTQRWDFTVTVLVREDGSIVIDDANVVRPEDRDEQEAEEATAPAGVLACPCCGHATLSERGSYQICPVCFWEDEGHDNDDADERSGPNGITLTEGRRNFLRIGASVEKDREHVRRPTAEEPQLRSFDADGRETTRR